MKINVFGKNVALTDALKNTVDKKVGKLDKFFHQDVEVKVVLSVEKNRQNVEITIPFNGTILRADETSTDIYYSIDDAVDVIERQIRKHKTKLQSKKHTGESIKFENIDPLYDYEEDAVKIVKTKRFAIKPMSIEEAVLQMDLLRHSFFVFLNADTEEVNVVYKRKDGNYGLIEPEL